MARDDGKGNRRPIIVIRREEVVEGGHHGGAWKVAYADFVTAMMAFFLLMWLLNATSEEQRKGLADYFSPTNIMSHNSSGSGQPFGGHTAFDQGAMVSDRGAVLVTVGKTPVPIEVEDDDSETPATALTHQRPAPKNASNRDDAQDASAGSGGALAAAPPTPGGPKEEAAAAATRAAMARPGAEPPPQSLADLQKREAQALEQAAQQLREAVLGDPGLAPFARQLAVDVTPEGLRIQILDEDHSPMFATGSAEPNERARLLIQKVAPVLLRLSEPLSIAGHTDAAPYRGADRSNWELSVERANMTRRLLGEAGLPEGRVRTVTGSADRDPLLPADPLAAANRRIAIVVLRTYPKVDKAAAEPATAAQPSPSAPVASPQSMSAAPPLMRAAPPTP